MASKKVTITLPEGQLKKVRSMVVDGGAGSVSAFVQRAVAMALDDLAGWEGSLEELLDQTGGPLNDEEQAWVDSVLGKPAA